MFEIPSIGYKWQILSCRLLKILTSQKDAKNFCLLQNKICLLSLRTFYTSPEPSHHQLKILYNYDCKGNSHTIRKIWR